MHVKTPTPIVRVKLNNTNENVVRALAETYGGSVFAGDNGPGNKTLFQWTLTGSSAIEFIRLIQPFLIVKVEQASLACSWASLKNSGKLTKELLKEILELSHLLNHRGA